MLRLPTENTLDREGKKMDFTITRFGDFAVFKYGKMPKKSEIKENGKYPIYSGYRYVGYYDDYNTEANQLIIVARGVGGTGDVKLTKERCYLTNLSISAQIDESVVLPQYLYYYFSLRNLRYLDSGSAQSQITISDLGKVEIPLPNIESQMRIVDCLSMLDYKIRTNEMINNNLLEQVLTLYRNKFVDTANNERAICRADEYFDISIGKTPPRKEPQWFSTNPQDVTWVSISDMGTCGLYISSSSEQLTKEAVDRHNVKIVPDNTVLLSFKLTVGRIAITNGEMTTNEAIAHFKTDKKEINEYLYCYLKCFNYQTMGSTSSIATAVNSKIIKGMPFVVPTDDELIDFHSVAAPMFAKIKADQTESEKLTAVRDTLLPKLMSGELDVSDIEI